MTHTPTLAALPSCPTCAVADASSLEGYGYCRAGESLADRARLIAWRGSCVFPSRFLALRDAGAA